MVKEVVTAAESQSGAGTFYDLTTDAAANSFTLEAGAFLNSSTNDSIILRGAAAWTVTINGHSSAGDEGLYETGSGNSKITIGEEGSLRATTNADWGALLLYNGGSNTVVNKGTIIGENCAGVFSDDTLVLTNSGLIAGGNSRSLAMESSTSTVTNTGTLLGDLLFSNANNKLVNSGLISHDTAYGAGNTHSDIFFGSGNDIFDNKGVIDGYVDLGGGLNKGTNSKSITGKDGSELTVFAGAGNDTFTNAKGASLAGGVDLGDGVNTFTNAGLVGVSGIYISFRGGEGVDTVKNSGTFEGDVDLDDGNDVFTNTGQVLGLIRLGDGDDTFKGGNFAERVIDDKGADTYALGGGNDTFFVFNIKASGDMTDTVDGGTGVDLYDAQNNAGGVYINFDSALHTSNGWAGSGTPVLNKSSAFDTVNSTFDNIKGFENFTGSFFNDIYFGSSGVNNAEGSGGQDELHGLGGNDVMDGGNGDDYLNGGLGADVLTGGSNYDQFDYSSVAESGATKATRDTITDFDVDFDALHFSGSLAGVFTSYIGQNATFTAAGQLKSYFAATGTMLEGDIDGDGKADFSVFFEDLTHSLQFSLVGDDLFGVE